MTITFNTNLAALGAQRNIGLASNAASSSLSKLSSGSRVPQAKDDAAALAVGSKLKGEVAGLTQAGNNAAQAISLLQIADGALATVGDIVQRMKTLATQASSGQLGTSERTLLNQEFSSLNNEVARIAATANFNGTTLLAGATSVAADRVGLAAYTGSNVTSVNNVIPSGFANIEFASNYGNGAARFEYDSTTRNLTAYRLSDGASQTVQLSASTIAAGATETASFGSLGITVTLNNQFDKTASIDGRNVAKQNYASGNFTIANTTGGTTLGAGGATSVTLTVSAQSFAGTGTNSFFGSDLAAATVAISGAVASATLGNITVGGKTFTNITGTTRDLSTAAATGVFNFSDGNGNTFSLTATVVGTATGTFSGTGTFFNAGTQGLVESGGTAATEASITRMVSGGTTAFNFGSIDNARITSSAVSGGNVTFSTTLNGVTFTSGNVDVSTTGTKTVTLTGVGGANTGNSITIQFNQQRAMGTGDSIILDMGDFGTVVGAVSSTTATTAFDFKVGTGTTSNDNITVTLNSATQAALGLSGLDILSAANANTAITAINSAIDAVSSRRADIGASQSRLEFATNNINVAIENATAATSALLDVDVSSEITTFTSKQVLLQAGVSLLAQANQQPALLLRLLQ